MQFLDVKFWEKLIGWMLTNAGEETPKLILSQLQFHPDACDATLAPASYCEPPLRLDNYRVTQNTTCEY